MRHIWIAALFFCLAWVASAKENTIILTYASPYSPNHPFSLADRTWIQWVEEQSGGGLKIKAYWSGALISSEQSLLEIRHRVADIGLITPIYVRGGAHLLRVQTGFYGGAETFEQQVALYRCLAGASPQYARELEGLKILAVQGGILPGILTRDRPVRSLEDLKGMRIRVPTELLRVLQDLGADAVSMPMRDVYSAMAKGVLDGVVAPADTLKSLHFSEIANYYTRLKVPRGAYPARAMGLRRWQSLPEAYRAVLEAGIPIWEAAMAEETGAAEKAGEAEGHRLDIEFIDIAPEDQKRFDTLYEEEGERNARDLNRFGIDGESVYHYARRIVRGIERTGKVMCEGTQTNHSLGSR
ncbi:MAG: TRAP transporter substrate-binding protein DctP [Acidobacteriota bacterium]|jgi:TRAP-type C4-dicarboxylate transport system substrate-binding protein